MISKEGALQDLEKVKKEAGNDVGKILLGVAEVIIKLLVTIRSNQMLTDADKVRIQEERKKRLASDKQQR